MQQRLGLSSMSMSLVVLLLGLTSAEHRERQEHRQKASGVQQKHRKLTSQCSPICDPGFQCVCSSGRRLFGRRLFGAPAATVVCACQASSPPPPAPPPPPTTVDGFNGYAGPMLTQAVNGNPVAWVQCAGTVPVDSTGTAATYTEMMGNWCVISHFPACLVPRAQY